MPGVRADLEKRRQRAYKLQMIAKDRPAPLILLGVDPKIALGLPERSEVVKLHLGALDGKRLRFHREPYFTHAPSRISISTWSVYASRSRNVAGCPSSITRPRVAGSTSFPSPCVICAPFGTGI